MIKLNLDIIMTNNRGKLQDNWAKNMAARVYLISYFFNKIPTMKNKLLSKQILRASLKMIWKKLWLLECK